MPVSDDQIKIIAQMPNLAAELNYTNITGRTWNNSSTEKPPDLLYQALR
jgi:hypothetical protein